jgi:hypothetical protein
MRFSYEGREYEFGPDLTVDEAILIQDKAKLGLNQYNYAIQLGNPYAVLATVLIGKRRAGEAVRWEDLMAGKHITSFVIHQDEPADAESGETGSSTPRSADPTSSDGETPSEDTAVTS